MYSPYMKKQERPLNSYKENSLLLYFIFIFQKRVNFLTFFFGYLIDFQNFYTMF